MIPTPFTIQCSQPERCVGYVQILDRTFRQLEKEVEVSGIEFMSVAVPYNTKLPLSMFNARWLLVKNCRFKAISSWR